jgi:hypothetical protein
MLSRIMLANSTLTIEPAPSPPLSGQGAHKTARDLQDLG